MRKRTPAALAGMLALGLALGLGSVSAASAATAGSLDPAFGHGGVVLTNLNAGATDAALQSNGDIVVAGAFGLARYLPNGALDTTFGVRGVAALPAFGGIGPLPAALAVEPDGEYIWAGEATAPGGSSGAFAAVRFNANGTVDQSFGTGGTATTTFPNAGVQGPDTVLVQPDGKILLGGEVLPDARAASPEGALARFNANGTLDQTFGRGGQVLSTAAVGNITALGLDAAGNIFALPAHAEFTPAGQPDATVTPAPVTASSHGPGATFLASGGYVLATATTVARHDTDIQVQRFNADGTVAATSPAFDYSGATGLDQAQDGANAVAVQPNGQIVVAGAHFAGGSSPIGVARVNGNGSLDTAFGTGGTLTTTIQGDEGAATVLIQPDGKIIVAGFSQDNSTGVTDVFLARYLG